VLASARALFAPLGELKSVTFCGPDLGGGDTYNLQFANGGMIMGAAVGPDGKILGGSIQPAAPAGRCRPGRTAFAGIGMSATQADTRANISFRPEAGIRKRGRAPIIPDAHTGGGPFGCCGS
jgi:hypothetical protein